MKVIFGLGNPGKDYERTRHNVGWWMVDHLADAWHFDPWRKDGESRVADGKVGSARVRLIKPQTYMNLSGSVLRPYIRRPFWSPVTDLMVIVDEVALPDLTLALRQHRVFHGLQSAVHRGEIVAQRHEVLVGQEEGG